MGRLATSLVEWLEGELRRCGLEVTDEDLWRIAKVLEEREWISVHPELYRRLMEDASSGGMDE